MNILGFDTSTKFLCLGIYKDGRIYESNLNLGIRHSALLIPKIKQLLKRSRLRIEDIGYFAVGLGPGSFTGTRIGAATIKGLTFGAKSKVIGISTLDMLSRNADLTESTFVCPIIDARRNLLYAGIYKNNKRISPYMLISLEELLRKIKKYKAPVAFLGDGLNLYQKGIRKALRDAIFLKEDLWYPEARNLLEIALMRITQKKFDDVFKLKPIYLYPKECQIRKWQK